MGFDPGVRLGERYSLVRRIGRGGMSEVWRADDELLGRAVAVKLPAVALAADPGLRAAIRREARSVARLSHPQVTQVYDYGETWLAGGVPVPYLVMELVDGRSLAERLGWGPLRWPAAAGVAAQVAAGLAAAHRLGMVHRDIKPGNVMLTATGAKILDFGIAALTGAQPEAGNAALIGTPAYAAPERLRPGPADPAGDVYSLGVLLFESLTGRTPITIGSWDEAVVAHQVGRPVLAPSGPDLPVRVAELCRSCLAPEPAARPSAAEVATRLVAALGGPSSPAAHFPPTIAAAGRPTIAAAGRPTATVTGQPVAASAPIVRPDPGPDPATGAGGPATAAQPAPRSRVAAAATGGVVVAVGLVVALAVAAARPDVDGSTRAQPSRPPNAGTAAAAPSTERPAPTTSPPPSTFTGVVEQFGLLLVRAIATGRLSPDAAKELRDELEALRDKLRERKRGSLRDKAEDLDQEIEDQRREGEIDDATAEQLRRLLRPLLDRPASANEFDGRKTLTIP